MNMFFSYKCEMNFRGKFEKILHFGANAISFGLLIPEENLAKSESSMLPESKMNFDYTIDYRKH